MTRKWIALVALLAGGGAISPLAHAAGLATCVINATPLTGGGFSVRFLGSGNIPQGEFSTNAWVGSISGFRSDGSPITYSFTAATRSVDNTQSVPSLGTPYGQIHADLKFAGTTQYVACTASVNAAWTPAGSIVLPA